MTEVVRIPISSVREELLCSLIEEFVLREGTEYGESEVSLEEKVAQVRRQLERGEAEIVFDPESESCNIVIA